MLAKSESGCFALECDEVMDSQSGKQQIVICLRWVDSKLESDEGFIRLHYVGAITSDTVVYILNDMMLCINLSITVYWMQHYDGASDMKKTAKKIKDVEPCALYL